MISDACDQPMSQAYPLKDVFVDFIASDQSKRQRKAAVCASCYAVTRRILKFFITHIALKGERIEVKE